MWGGAGQREGPQKTISPSQRERLGHEVWRGPLLEFETGEGAGSGIVEEGVVERIEHLVRQYLKLNI